MKAEHWQRIEELYQAALQVPQNRRAQFVAEACAGNDLLRREIESLLKQEDRAKNFMETPALMAMAQSMAAERASDCDIRIEGRTISHYRVLQALGHGGMGVVYKAEDLKLRRYVALKLLPAYLAHDRQALKRFQREAQAASALNHPNICTVYEIDEAEGLHFIAIEFLDGETLKERMARGPLKIDEILRITIEICEALDVAHSSGIAHRDIKPANIFITGRGSIKVLDFGIAKRIGPPELTLSLPGSAALATITLDGTLAGPGAVVGTIAYMSPEQARRQEVDTRTDLFSLGTVLYEMTTRQLPFPGELVGDVLNAIQNRTPTPVGQLNPICPSELSRIISKALEKEPSFRYQHASEMRNDLQKLKARLSSKWWHHSSFVLVMAAVLLITVGAFIFSSGSWRVRPKAGPYTIAVLPFKNLSSEPGSDYFSDGLTDETIRNLSLIEGLQVRSRTSSFVFKDKPRNIHEVGAQLGANLVLEGSVLRSGDKLRINAQLVRVADDLPLWSGRFDRELKDVFAIQDEISRSVVNELRLKLGGGQRRYNTNLKAYELYLKAETLTNLPPPDEDIFKSIPLFEEAIADDPGFAPAYAGIAAAYARLSATPRVLSTDVAYPKMRLAAEKALELDPLLAEAHAGIGLVYSRDYAWEEAEKAFRRAIQLDPNLSRTRVEFADAVLFPLGRLEEALRELRTALELDPLSADVHIHIDFVLISAGRYDEVLDNCRRFLATDPNDAFLDELGCGRAVLQKGRLDEAIAIFKKSDAPAFLGYAYAKAGRRAEAEQVASGYPSWPWVQALVYAGLGDKDRAFEGLEGMAAIRDPRVSVYLTYPEFSLLRGDPRLSEFRRKLRLPPAQ
jgi:serine/threonine protein kinase